jgi:hypothetical protein
MLLNHDGVASLPSLKTRKTLRQANQKNRFHQLRICHQPFCTISIKCRRLEKSNG